MSILGGKSRRSILALTIVIVILISWLLWFKSPPLTQLTLQIREHTIQAEVADNDKTRERGLMFRLRQSDNEGMLFVLPEAQGLCMWMKYTFIPLSVAFITDNGVIVNMAEMQPLNLQEHCAQKPVKFALEMPKSWFATKSVSVGDKVTGLPGK